MVGDTSGPEGRIARGGETIMFTSAWDYNRYAQSLIAAGYGVAMVREHPGMPVTWITAGEMAQRMDSAIEVFELEAAETPDDIDSLISEVRRQEVRERNRSWSESRHKGRKTKRKW